MGYLPTIPTPVYTAVMDNRPIAVLVTGGTFDKEYNELDGSLYFKDTHLPEMLNLGRSRLDLEIDTLMMIDSLEMNDAHRAQILAACASHRQDRILVTHGTDTMAETARFLELGLNAAGPITKTVVLTGAMIPWKFGSSDGMFNLGSALAYVQSLPPGVYVAMNGRAFPAATVGKRRDLGEFTG